VGGFYGTGCVGWRGFVGLIKFSGWLAFTTVFYAAAPLLA
jgi:hypothetical protein